MLIHLFFTEAVASIDATPLSIHQGKNISQTNAKFIFVCFVLSVHQISIFDQNHCLSQMIDKLKPVWVWCYKTWRYRFQRWLYCDKKTLQQHHTHPQCRLNAWARRAVAWGSHDHRCPCYSMYVVFHMFLMFKHWFCWIYQYNKFMFNFIDIYSFIPVSGCVGIIIILYSKSNTALRYINTNYKQYMIHYTQYIIIAEHDINLGITNFFQPHINTF